MGTIPLTRRLSRPAARGIFVLGDAAGYVEPFTGEGMAWAFAGAEAVVPFVIRATQSHERRLEREWIGAYARRHRPRAALVPRGGACAQDAGDRHAARPVASATPGPRQARSGASGAAPSRRDGRTV